MHRQLPKGWDANLPTFTAADGPMATRIASGKTIAVLGPRLPELMGGSADLAPSTHTNMDGAGSFEPENRAGRNMHFGIREHAMGAILNGMALHRGLIPYGATFLIFSDYMRPPMRLAAMNGLPVIYVFTHDSIAMGEDGPTHQPVEQLLGLRSIPGMVVIRPADANETVAAWRIAIERRGGPVTLVLTRQGLPVLDPARYPGLPAGVPRGGYVLADSPPGTRPDIILIATGSEVHLALEARDRLASEGVRARVVSVPSTDLFSMQSDRYRDEVLPPGVPLLAIEAGTSLGWRSYRRSPDRRDRCGHFRGIGPRAGRDGALWLHRGECLQASPSLAPAGQGETMMRVGIAADHGGFTLKGEVAESLRGSGYEVVDFGADQLNPGDDYPDFIIPLARAVAAGEVERGVALCGSGVGASIAANKVPGVRAGLIHDVFSAHQGVEDDDMNVFCLGGKVIGSALARELIETFLAAHFSGAERHKRRLAKVQALEEPESWAMKGSFETSSTVREVSRLQVMSRREHEDSDQSDPETPRNGPESLARQHHPRSADQRHAPPLHPGVLGHGAHLEPHDLRPRHQEQSRLRRRHPPEIEGRQVGRGAVLRAGAGGPARRPPICFGRSTTRPTAWTAGCRWRSRPCWPTTRPAPSPRPRNSTPGRDGPISSSRYRAPRRASPPSRKRSSRACRST